MPELTESQLAYLANISGELSANISRVYAAALVAAATASDGISMEDAQKLARSSVADYLTMMGVRWG